MAGADLPQPLRSPSAKHGPGFPQHKSPGAAGSWVLYQGHLIPDPDREEQTPGRGDSSSPYMLIQGMLYPSIHLSLPPFLSPQLINPSLCRLYPVETLAVQCWDFPPHCLVSGIEPPGKAAGRGREEQAGGWQGLPPAVAHQSRVRAPGRG